MDTSWNKNEAFLRGRAAAAPRPSHSNHGVEYLTFPLEVERLSGAADTLNIVLPGAMAERCPIYPGRHYQVEGEVRSYNNRSGVGRRLVITLLARSVSPAPGRPCDNRLELAGTICKPPTFRRTPLGREICDLLLAVNRRYGRADYLPCIAWGSLARSCGTLEVGDALGLVGRLQSRVYHKVVAPDREEARTAYEVSIMGLNPVP